MLGECRFVSFTVVHFCLLCASEYCTIVLQYLVQAPSAIIMLPRDEVRYLYV